MMKKILLSLFALILIIEEWLWEILSAFGHYLAQVLGLAKFEQWLMQTTPYQALFAISIPILIVTPINILALLLLAQGLILQGIGLEIFAKLLGTVFIARFFKLTKNQLLTFRLIHWIYQKVTFMLQWAHQRVIETKIYQWSREIKAEIKLKMAAWLKKL